MTRTETLKLRLTNHYVDAYNTMDDWEEMGTIHYGPSQLLPNGNATIDGWRSSLVVEVDLWERTNRHRIALALRHTLGGSNCTHDYDCCGCITTSVLSAVRLYENIWAVLLDHRRNV